MSEALIRECWSMIHRIDSKLLVDDFQPLLHIEPYLSSFDLPPLQGPSLEAIEMADLPAVEPSFKHLTDEILFSLRQHLYSQTSLDTVSHWAETLMRFCEVRFPSLRKRCLEKCGTEAASRLHILHLASFLMDHALSTKDLRFCNTALKLAHLKWVLNRNALPGKIRRHGRDLSRALFQFRLMLSTESVMKQVREGTFR